MTKTMRVGKEKSERKRIAKCCLLHNNKGQGEYEVDYTLEGLVFIVVINRKLSKGLFFG